MDIFGEAGQAEVRSLSDESLFGDEERQEEEQKPQTEPDDVDAPDNQGEVEEETDNEEEEVEEETAAPEEGQAEEEPDELTSLRSQYDNLRKWATQTAMENGDLKRRLESMNTQSQQAATPTPEQADAARKALLKNFLEHPDDVINKAVEERLAEKLRPIEEERQRNLTNQRITAAIEDAATGWKQLDSAEGKKAMLVRMMELSAQEGDSNAWQRDPRYYSIAACRSLWGWPMRADPTAVEAAKKAAIETVREQQAANKEGLSVKQTANKQPSKDPTPEEMILAEMRATKGGGIFD